MKFKELLTKDKEYLSVIYTQQGLSHKEKMDILSKKFNAAPRTIRQWASKMGIRSSTADFRLSSQLVKALDRKISNKSDILLVTAAQNKTPIHEGFLANLKSYSEFLKTQGYNPEIVIIPIKYRNPTVSAEKANEKTEDWWMDEIDEYLHYSKIKFGDTIVSADSRVVPTASMPLNGYESLASANNLVLGHPRIHLKTIPRFKGQNLYTMNTTGFCTLKHYSRSKSGDKAFIHHSYGFTIIEKKPNSDKSFKPRCVKVNSDGSFTDVIHFVENQNVTIIKSTKGLILGDIHHENLDIDKMDKNDELITKIKPKEIVLHDLFDGSTVNPHEQKDLFIRKRKIIEGKHLIQNEIDNALDFVKTMKTRFPNLKLNIIQSNHDDFLDRFVNTFDWKKDLHNSETYLRLASIQQGVDLREYGNIFGWLLNQEGFNYLKNHESYFIGDYQVGHHGEYGINGARGSINSFKKLNQKMIHGHTHSPAIIDGVTCVGVSCKLWQYYNSKGLSSWAHSDSIIHESGKNQLIIYDDNYEFSNFL